VPDLSLLLTSPKTQSPFGFIANCLMFEGKNKPAISPSESVELVLIINLAEKLFILSVALSKYLKTKLVPEFDQTAS
jgi:hypothetical protein